MADQYCADMPTVTVDLVTVTEVCRPLRVSSRLRASSLLSRKGVDRVAETVYASPG